MKDGLFGFLLDQENPADTIRPDGYPFRFLGCFGGLYGHPRLPYQNAPVACIIQYTGGENLAILDGRCNKGFAEKRPLSTKTEHRESQDFRGKHLDDKTFKEKEELAILTKTTAGKERAAAVVIHCAMGQCCPTWSFPLTQVFGYTNGRLYMGSCRSGRRTPGRRR